MWPRVIKARIVLYVTIECIIFVGPIKTMTYLKNTTYSSRVPSSATSGSSLCLFDSETHLSGIFRSYQGEDNHYNVQVAIGIGVHSVGRPPTKLIEDSYNQNNKYFFIVANIHRTRDFS